MDSSQADKVLGLVSEIVDDAQKVAEPFIQTLESAAEFIEHGTPIYPGSDVANAILAAVGRTPKS